MMLFLIDYDRKAGKIVEMRTFDDSQGQNARDQRFALELQYHREKRDREVVLLKAEDEKSVRRTHRRYFESLKELYEAAGR